MHGWEGSGRGGNGRKGVMGRGRKRTEGLQRRGGKGAGRGSRGCIVVESGQGGRCRAAEWWEMGAEERRGCEL